MRWESAILRTGGLLSVLECQALAEAAKSAPPGDALEVGHYTGLSTCVLLSSLPLTSALVTIDNHKWRNVTDREFHNNIDRFFAPDLEVIIDDFERALPRLRRQFSFVFYDAMHELASVREFMRLVEPLLLPDCVLAFDDADWESQDEMRLLAEKLGFVESPKRALRRHKLGYSTGDEQFDLDNAKRHPDTFTLRVMRRESHS